MPFCIFHSIDPETNTYLGYISNPTEIQDKNGITLKCTQDRSRPSWFLYGSFYAVSPMFRPIPSGLKLIKSVGFGKFPYGNKDIKFQYDPFNIEHKSVPFLAWTQPVPNTVPLYIWSTERGNAFPTFDDEPYDKTRGWKQLIISPIFVLVDVDEHSPKVDSSLHPLAKFDKNKYGIPKFRFKAYNGRCLPAAKGMTLEDCFLITDEDIINASAGGGPQNILSIIQSENEIAKSEQFNIPNLFRNISPIWITICITILILSLIACIIALSK